MKWGKWLAETTYGRTGAQSIWYKETVILVKTTYLEYGSNSSLHILTGCRIHLSATVPLYVSFSTALGHTLAFLPLYFGGTLSTLFIAIVSFSNSHITSFLAHSYHGAQSYIILFQVDVACVCWAFMTLFKIPLRLLLPMSDLETMAVFSVAPGTSDYMQLTSKKHHWAK